MLPHLPSDCHALGGIWFSCAGNKKDATDYAEEWRGIVAIAPGGCEARLTRTPQMGLLQQPA
ncbi:MAG TPA: hypothetical protein VEU07_04770, partial [Candidatus Acidoferrum sp.]|nr:hypothetical protein [Candidatus Acidoferrum sp.]